MQPHTKLKNLKIIDKSIIDLNDELEKLNVLKLSAKNQQYDSVGGGSTNVSDPTGDMASSIVQLEHVLRENILNLAKEKAKAISIISALEDKMQMRILNLYYIKNMTFNEVAEEMEMSYQWTWELHKRAIHAYDLKYAEKEEFD